jgi:hypothetical protein
VPVVIFLYGDHSGMPRSEADHFIDELLQTSAIAYGVKDRRSPQLGRFESMLWGEQAAVANYIATRTGANISAKHPKHTPPGCKKSCGSSISATPGFKPATLDGKHHRLRVELSDAANNQRKGVLLKCRAAYVVTGQGIAQSAQSVERTEDTSSSAGAAEQSATEPLK